MPILVENWNVNGRIQSSLTDPPNLLTKFLLPGVRFKEIVFRGTQNRSAAVTNPVCSIIPLGPETIHELITSEYVVME